MKNVKKLNEETAAFRELPDESLDAVAGGANYGSVSYCFKPGDKVKFTTAGDNAPYLDGVVSYSYLKEYNGQTIPHYAITVNHYTGSTTFYDVPQHRIRFPF